VKRLKKPVQELGEKILFRRISLVKSVICIELCSIMTLIQHPRINNRTNIGCKRLW
jgi:hypothetical protein